MAANNHGMMSVQTGEYDDVAKMDTDSFERTPQMKYNLTGGVTSGGDNSTSEITTPNVTAPQQPQTPKEKPALGEVQPVAPSTSGTAASPSTEGAATTDLDLLLIGKSGVGKSATGNSILGKKVFRSSASLSSVTDKISSDVSKVKGLIIKVVDGPGVGDTRMDTEEGIRLFVESMEHAMFTNPAGYHAFLLVLRFGTRFTQEDIDTIALLKKVFGEDFVKNYCILVMTCGDMFKYEAEENNVTFLEWVNQQTGAMSELVTECQGRIVLFDNTTKKQEEKEAQLDKLVGEIGYLNNKGKRYTDANFENAVEARKKVIVESKVPIARDATIQAITLLMQELGKIRERGAESEDIATSEAIVQDLEKLLKEAEVVRQDVTEQDKGTGALKDLLQSVETVEKSIQNSLELHNMAVESRRRQQESETEVASRMKELEEQMATAKQDEERKRYMEENERLKLEIAKIEREREMQSSQYQQRHNEAWNDLGSCQDQFQNYQVRREITIFQSIRQFGGAIVRGMMKMVRRLLTY